MCTVYLIPDAVERDRIRLLQRPMFFVAMRSRHSLRRSRPRRDASSSELRLLEHDKDGKRTSEAAHETGGRDASFTSLEGERVPN